MASGSASLTGGNTGATLKDTSLFLNLPTEIRLDVYKQVFEGAVISLQRQQNGFRTFSRHHYLLLSCWTCYRKGLPLFYEAAIWSFGLGDRYLGKLCYFPDTDQENFDLCWDVLDHRNPLAVSCLQYLTNIHWHWLPHLPFAWFPALKTVEVVYPGLGDRSLTLDHCVIEDEVIFNAIDLPFTCYSNEIRPVEEAYPEIAFLLNLSGWPRCRERISDQVCAKAIRCFCEVAELMFRDLS
jgi:hypothetical protein